MRIDSGPAARVAGGLTRRGLLSRSAALAGSRLLPASALATLAAPTPARAEAVTAALAAASVVAGMIAAHNRRGEGAMLTAMDQKLDVMIGQVASLQQSVGMVLERLAELPGRIDELLKAEHTRRTHLAIQAAILTYQNKIQPVRKNYRTLGGLLRNEGGKEDVQAVLNKLYDEMSLLDVSKAYGPNTALLIPSAIALEYSLLLMRGDQPRDIAERLERNLPWFAKIAAAHLPTSAEAYRLAAIRRRDEATQAAAATQFGRALDLKPGTVVFDCAGINDYRKRSYSRGPCHFSMVGDRGRTCDGFDIPERVGPRERMVADLVLEERPVPVSVEIDGRSEVRNANFTVPVLTRSVPSGVLRDGDPQVPAQCPQVLVVDQENPAARAGWMRERIERSPKNADLDTLKRHLASIAEERARISYAEAALAAMAAAKPTAEAMIRDLRA